MTTLELYTKVLFKGFVCCQPLVPGANFAIANLSVGFSSFLQGARVWIPHDQVVWIGGELTKDLKEDGVLEIELDDGNVSCH